MRAITAAPSEGHGSGETTRIIIAASLGNTLEFREILVCAYFAFIMVYFPIADETVSLLVTFGTFGASFLARPVGTIFLGSNGDCKGTPKQTCKADPARA
jgi:MFS transporter, MHS family, proline/betaine transporter